MEDTRTKKELKRAALEVTNETEDNANTQKRIGGILYDIVEHLDPDIPHYVSYRIVPTHSILQFDVNPETNLYTPKNFVLRCKVEKTVGDETTTYDATQSGLIVDDYTLYYKTITRAGEGDYIPYEGSITIDSGDNDSSPIITSVNFYLIGSDYTVIRQVNVPVLRNGKSMVGEPGEDAVRLNIGEKSDIIPCDASGITQEKVYITAKVSIYKGAKIQKDGVAVDTDSLGTIENIQAEEPTTTGDGEYDIVWEIPEGTQINKNKYNVKIGMTYNNIAYYTTLVVGVLKGAKDGESPTVRYIHPIPPQLLFKTGEEEIPQNLKLEIRVVIGNIDQYLPVSESGLTVRYSFKHMPETADEEEESDVYDWTPELDESGLDVTYSMGDNVYVKAFDSTGNKVHDDVISILRDGRDGRDGKSSLGRFYYYAGDWSQVEAGSLIANDHTSPYVQYAVGDEINYYMWTGLDTTHIYESNPNDNPYWQEMEKLDYLISKAIFSQFAKLGGFVISGSWMISQEGTRNESESSEYIYFREDHPNDSYQDPITGLYNFIPNYTVDGKTGATYQNNAVVRGIFDAAWIDMRKGTIANFSVEPDVQHHGIFTANGDETSDDFTQLVGNGQMVLKHNTNGKETFLDTSEALHVEGQSSFSNGTLTVGTINIGNVVYNSRSYQLVVDNNGFLKLQNYSS